MSLERYDQALLEKLKKVYPNTIFSPLPKIFEQGANIEVESKDHEGKVEKKEKQKQVVALPMIAFDRINNSLNLEYAANDPMIRRGRHVIKDFDQPTREDMREKALPINPQYQVDIVSDKRVEVDGIWRELVMFLYTNPNLTVKFQDGEEEFEEKFNIHIMETDNTTDVEDFSNRGRIYRQTLNLEIPSAKLLFIDKVNVIREFPVRIIELKEDEDVQSKEY